MAYWYLGIAIVAEVVATTAMKMSDGFTRPAPTLVMAVGYAVSFYLLSLVLRSIPTGVAYAIWSGAGIVLISAIAWLYHGQKLDLPAIAGMGLIISGVAVLNLFSKVTPH